VSPITNSLTFNFLAIAEAQSTSHSAPNTIAARPAISNNISVNIILSNKYSRRAACGGTYPQAARQ
jgi:hypothetical protein